MKKVLLGLLIGLVVCLSAFAVLYKLKMLYIGKNNNCVKEEIIENYEVKKESSLSTINKELSEYMKTNYYDKGYQEVFFEDLIKTIDSLPSKIYGVNKEVKDFGFEIDDKYVEKNDYYTNGYLSIIHMYCEGLSEIVIGAFKKDNMLDLILSGDNFGLENGGYSISKITFNLENYKAYFNDFEFVPVNREELNLCIK